LSRQLLINELERIYLEEKEKKKDLLDDLYVFSKYPKLAQLFQLYRSPNEKWFQVVREVLFYEKEDLRYMYNRVMQLIRRFRQSVGSYFVVNSATGTYLLPDRLSDLNRLSGLFEEFFYEIYPQISGRLNFDVQSQEKISELLHGRVDWTKTILRSAKNASGYTPLRFATFLPLSLFRTPENLLLVFSILRMRQDAGKIHGFPFTERLIIEERTTLEKIFAGCTKLLNNSVLQELVPEASKYLQLEPSDPHIISLEAQVAAKVHDEGRRLAPYSRLLDWSVRYRQLNLRSLSPNRTNFPIDRRENLDTMFEVWVLFEFLDYLSNKGAIVDAESYPERFTIKMDGLNFNVYYEKNYQGWAIRAKPDFTIEIDENRPIIMDAKNWQEDKVDAIYKMLGILNNLDAELGILFFPNGTALPNDRIIRPSGLRTHTNQCFMNCVVSPSDSEEGIRSKLAALAQGVSLIIEYLRHPATY